MKILLAIAALLIPNLCLGADYSEALSKAREAAYIQTGAQQFVNDVQSYGVRRLKFFADDVGIRHEAEAVGAVVWAVRNKQVKLPLSKDDRLILRPDSVMLVIGL